MFSRATEYTAVCVAQVDTVVLVLGNYTIVSPCVGEERGGRSLAAFTYTLWIEVELTYGDAEGVEEEQVRASQRI